MKKFFAMALVCALVLSGLSQDVFASDSKHSGDEANTEEEVAAPVLPQATPTINPDYNQWNYMALLTDDRVLEFLQDDTVSAANIVTKFKAAMDDGMDCDSKDFHRAIGDIAAVYFPRVDTDINTLKYSAILLAMKNDPNTPANLKTASEAVHAVNKTTSGSEADTEEEVAAPVLPQTIHPLQEEAKFNANVAHVPVNASTKDKATAENILKVASMDFSSATDAAIVDACVNAGLLNAHVKANKALSAKFAQYIKDLQGEFVQDRYTSTANANADAIAIKNYKLAFILSGKKGFMARHKNKIAYGALATAFALDYLGYFSTSNAISSFASTAASSVGSFLWSLVPAFGTAPAEGVVDGICEVGQCAAKTLASAAAEVYQQPTDQTCPMDALVCPASTRAVQATFNNATQCALNEGVVNMKAVVDGVCAVGQYAAKTVATTVKTTLEDNSIPAASQPTQQATTSWFAMLNPFKSMEDRLLMAKPS